MNLNKDYGQYKRYNMLLIFIYCSLFLLGIKTLFHGFPDIERFFAEWMDERITITTIMKFGTLNFAPAQIMHPPLYHYLTFIPIAIFFIIGKIAGTFHDKIDFVRFYFNNTHCFFFIGRMMSFLFFWLSAFVIFKIARLFYNRIVSHITAISYLLIPRFIFDVSTTRPETLLFLNASLFFYFFLKYYIDNTKIKYLFISAFLLGLSIATKYNAAYLGAMFIILLVLQLKDRRGMDYERLIKLYLKAFFFIVFGFFISNPFFIIQLDKYLTGLMVYNIEMKDYWKGFQEGHLRELASSMYINLFGIIILCAGLWSLFKKDRKLFIIIFFSILIYEIYFGIWYKNYAPLRYLNPLVPLLFLSIGAGIDFIMKKQKAVFIIAVFICILMYNYIDIWGGLSLGPTHIQKARSFIEETVPEFTTICITSCNYIPQLNMTEDTYSRFMSSIPKLDHIRGSNLAPVETMDDVFKRLRIESLAQKPRYNIIIWDTNIRTTPQAEDFLKRNNIKFIVSRDKVTINGRKLEDIGIASLIKEFKPRNQRIYKAVFSDVGVFIYKVNQAYGQ